MTLKEIADNEKVQAKQLDARYMIISGIIIALIVIFALWLSQINFILIDLFNVLIDLFARLIGRVINLFV